LQNPEKICNSFFPPITKENTSTDYEIRKLQGHFGQKHRARENDIGWKKQYSFIFP